MLWPWCSSNLVSPLIQKELAPGAITPIRESTQISTCQSDYTSVHYKLRTIP